MASNILVIVLVLIILALVFGGGIVFKIVSFLVGVVLFLILLAIAVWIVRRL